MHEPVCRFEVRAAGNGGMPARNGSFAVLWMQRILPSVAENRVRGKTCDALENRVRLHASAADIGKKNSKRRGLADRAQDGGRGSGGALRNFARTDLTG